MAEGPDRQRRHFILEGVTETESYRYPGPRGGGSSETPARNRPEHGGELQRQIGELRTVAESARDAQQAAGIEDGLGLQVEFESFPDIELAFESLAREHQGQAYWGIELLNVRHEEERPEKTSTFATVFVPDGKLDHFERLIRDYLAEKRDRAGNRRDNQRLIDAIREIRAASLRALWTDSPDVFPTAADGEVWWEVWLPVRRDRRATLAAFRERAQAQGMEVAEGELIFPERTVLMARSSVKQMQRSMVTLNSIAELRRPKETADFFDSLEREEQAMWLDDLLGRLRIAGEADDVPYACLLDTGVNRGHRLLSPALDSGDLHTVQPGWGTDDADGHGTEMAGLALAGNLSELLDGADPVEIAHRLELVKLIPRDAAPGADPRHHGYRTMEAVARPEITAPLRRRVFGLAVTARDNRDRGRPSAWSAAIDSLAVDFEGDGGNPRLLVVSAGNVRDPNAWPHYPASNETEGVHDPAQAWNALTSRRLHRVRSDHGARHRRTMRRLLPEGGLSPFSTTSLTWEPRWPLKPDVVFEGGNAARDRWGAVHAAQPRTADDLLPPRGPALHDHQRHKCGDRARFALRRTDNGALSRTVAGDCPRVDCAFGGMDRCHETSVPSAASSPPARRTI